MKITTKSDVLSKWIFYEISNYMSMLFKMKSKIFFLSDAIMVVVTSCTEDTPEVSSMPSFKIQDVNTSLPGETFTMSGIVSDPVGIQSVHLQNSEWFLDKEIEVDPTITQYPFSYSFKVPDTETEGSEHVITISSINNGNKESSTEISMTEQARMQLC